MEETLRILVIEDDTDTLANLTDILDLDGHHVVGVSSLTQAKQVAEKETFAIAISDRKLPDGLVEDLLPELKKSLEGTEIIVVTGFADMQSTIAAFRQGVTDYVIKPIIPDDLRATVRRIAEHRRLQAELRQEHEFAELILGTAEAIVLVLDLDGRVIQFNRFFQDLTGWTSDELTGKNWFDHCIPDSEREMVREVFIRTARDSQTQGVVNFVLARNGRRYQIRWSNTTLTDDAGRPTSVLAVGVDISDLDQAQRRALQAERLAVIGQTMTALAHESRNALQRIQAATEMLELEVEDNENAKKDVASIQRASHDLQSLLEEVRSFAAPIHLEYEKARLSDLWRRIRDDLCLVYPDREFRITESIQGCDLVIDVDVMRIGQVIRNLMENALQACSDPTEIEIQSRCDKDWVNVSFTDNGPGFDTDDSSRMFDAFFTTKPTGTGLGLAICQRIVEAHGGKITAESTDAGARFSIRLPVSQESKMMVTADRSPQTGSH